MLLWTVLVVSLVAADPVRRIVIDGDFSDWAQVPKRSDPFRVSATEPSPQDGFPPAPDVHSDEDSEDTCHVRTEAFNPYSDVVEVALAHDEHQFFAYFKSVKSMAFTTSGQGGQAGLLYVQVNLDLDNNLTTGYSSSRGGYYPNQNGVDMAFELEFYNGTLNTAHIILHNMWNDSQKPAVEELNKQGRSYFDGPANYKSYTEWAYWTAAVPPTADEAARCATGPVALTSGPYQLPDGAWICFVMDKCHGPFLGAMQVSLSADGTELEMSAPFDAFLRHRSTGNNVVGVGQTVSVQMSLETSGQLSSTGSWTTDATVPWVYHIGPAELPVVALVLVPAASFLTGGILAALLVCFCRSKRSGYSSVQ